MLVRVLILLLSVIFAVPNVNAQRGRDIVDPLPQRTPETDREALRLMRNDKLDLVLPGAMRDNNVDMWIHVTRGQDPLIMQFGQTSGYLIFTDLGDRIERAHFGGSAGAIENIDVWGSEDVARAFAGYNYDNSDPSQGYSVPDVFDEITDFVVERDPQTIAVNYSDFLPVSDGISYTQFLKLQTILGPKYSARIISAERVISDFLLRRTSREVAAQVEILALARQRSKQRLSQVIPGVTTAGEIGARIYYSAVNTPDKTVPKSQPDIRRFLNDPDYVLQRGDLFVGGGGGGPLGSYMGFGVDTKIHAYILREGESKVPNFIQEVFDLAIAGQWIMRPHMRVGMTAGESLAAMVEAMEGAGYIFTPFSDIGEKDYKMIQRVLANTDKPGFSIDNHSMINNAIDTREVEFDTRTEGPSMAAHRTFTHHLKIQENHLFAFEYMVHKKIAERPGYPLAFNISNPQIITSKGVEFIQPPNEEIFIIK